MDHLSSLCHVVKVHLSMATWVTENSVASSEKSAHSILFALYGFGVNQWPSRPKGPVDEGNPYFTPGETAECANPNLHRLH